MAADLGLVAYAAERHADELAAERPRNRLADRGLAGAGRADQGQDRPGALVLLDAALLAQLADGEVLHDPVLDVVEAVVVLVQDLARVLGVEPLVGALRPRHGDEPVEVGANDGCLWRLLADALEPAELALRLLLHLFGHAGLGDLRAVLVDDRGVVVPELLLDRLELPAQDVLTLLLLHTRVDVVADPPAHLQLGQAVALDLHCQLETRANLDGLEQLNLAREGHVGRIAGRIGERAGLGDRADEGGDTAVVAAQLEDLLDDRAVLGLELADASRTSSGSGRSSTSTRRRPSASLLAAPAMPRCRPLSVTARPPPGRRTRSATSATVPTLA